MQKNPDDSTITLTEAEMKSLSKVIEACWDAFSSLDEGDGILGYNNYYALGMWDDKLKSDENHKLSRYMPDYADDGQVDTVDEWLEAYGKALW